MFSGKKKGGGMNYSEWLADEHWEYTSKVMELMYKEAFQHGFKHGYDQRKEEEKK